MPQASEFLRKIWADEEDGVGENKAVNFLQSHGFTLQRDWWWKLPTPDHKLTQDERGALWFLIDEWDFGGIRE